MLQKLRFKIGWRFSSTWRAYLIMLGVSLLLVSVLSLFTGSFFKPILADELTDIYKQKSEKEKQLKDLDNQIKKILNSKLSVSQKIKKLDDKLKTLNKEQKNLNKQLQTLSNKLNEIRLQRKDLYKQGAGFLTQTTSWLTILKSLGKNQEQNINIVDSLLTYLSLKWYYSHKLAVLNAQEQQVYGQFLVTKKNYDYTVQLIKDLQKYLKDLKAQYAQTVQALNVSYSKRASLVNEITALSAKAKRIIEQKARQNNNSNTMGGNSGGTIRVNNGDGDFALRFGNQEINASGSLYFSVTGVSCNTNEIPTCQNGYMLVKIYNNTKTKDAGTWYYRGEVVISPTLSDAFFINKIRLEDYVLGIGEMPNSWGKTGGLEALKAQAVAARTYAYAKYQKGYMLYDTTLDQNYVGVKKEISTDGNYWVQAVASTKGQILKSGGQVISAYYHSSCGGATLSTQEVWGGYRPYALGTYDRYQENGKWVPYDKDSPYTAFARGNADVPMIYLKDIVNAAIYLKLHATGTYIAPEYQDKIACQLPIVSTVATPITFHTISLKQNCTGGSLSAESLVASLGNNAVDKQFDSITKVYATFIDNDGNEAGDQFIIGQKAKYTDSIVVEGTKNGAVKKIYIPAGFFKLAYNLRSPGSNYIGQPSKKGALFDIWQKPGDYSARTYGLGHRVGMCQYGAYGRAKHGQNYAQILAAYYANLDYVNGKPSVLYSNAGPTIRVKVTQVGRALCPSTYSCDSSIKNGTYITSIRAKAGSLIVKNAQGQVLATIPSNTWVDVVRK